MKNSLNFAANTYNDDNLVKDAENEQYKMLILLNKLNRYDPSKSQKIKSREETKCCNKIL